MTKIKTWSFNGAWMNGWLTASAPVPEWMGADRRDKWLDGAYQSENEARLGLLRIIAEARCRHAKEHYRNPKAEQVAITRAMQDSASIDVLSVVLRRLELWRIEQLRREVEPEPAEWAGLILNIEVPEQPSPQDIQRINRALGQLPLHAQAVLDNALLDAASVGRVGLITRMRQNPDPKDIILLRDTLASMGDAAKHLKGKRGTKRDIGPHLRAVCTALQVNCSYSLSAARPLAAELLRVAGIPAPKSRSQLTALAPR